MTEKNGKLKRIAHSLYVRLVIVIIFGLVVAIICYMISRFFTNNYISGYYVTEENRTAREEEYIQNLQNYVISNGISSEDTDRIARWAQNNRYVYLLIYKNNELFFSSDMLPETDAGAERENGSENVTGGDGEQSGSSVESEGGSVSGGSETDSSDKNENNSYGSGITVEFPTREELKKYAEENDLHELEMADGVLLASVAEFTEYFYYDLANIMSLVAAMIALAFVIINYFRKIISRVKRLDQNVMVVAGGDINHPITSNGYDEIARLSENVENMRCSIIESIEDEREARRANTELITAMSHDLRTPLTILLGYLDIMKNEATDEKMRAYVAASESTAMRLKDLSDDMFNYFLAFGSTKENFDVEEYDAETLLDQLLSEHMILLVEKGYEVNYDYNSPSQLTGFTVMTDAPKLMRIVDNIFSNLSKYADKSYPIEFSVSVVDDYFTLVVKNRIKKEREKAESNGIGLRTCQRLATFVAESFEYGYEGESFAVRLKLKLISVKEEETDV